ncbi:MAG: SapC family protein [Immundisolibacteraceae bacterium]|nr:SapC family protein [Immundisolibacteraceae bacterium]
MISPLGDYGHCKTARFLPVILSEFARVALEQPIVFVADHELIVPIAVLGLGKEVNFFVDEKDQWTGRYIPAYARMYPFILAPRRDGNDYSVCIDEDYPGFNEQQGTKLFDSTGSQSEFTQNAVAFASEYQREREQSLKFTARIKQLGLLEQANFSFGDEEEASVGGFMTINRSKLNGLSETDLLGLFEQNALELIYLQLASLANFDYLASLGK